jgi:hypothetical protein
MKYFICLFAPFLCFSQTIWGGSEISFTKANLAGFTQEQHQDRIKADVWLTRGDGGGLFNFKNESFYNDGVSPSLTLWALGDTSDNDHVFDNFKDFYGSGVN